MEEEETELEGGPGTNVVKDIKGESGQEEALIPGLIPKVVGSGRGGVGFYDLSFHCCQWPEHLVRG